VYVCDYVLISITDQNNFVDYTRLADIKYVTCHINKETTQSGDFNDKPSLDQLVPL